MGNSAVTNNQPSAAEMASLKGKLNFHFENCTPAKLRNIATSLRVSKESIAKAGDSDDKKNAYTYLILDQLVRLRKKAPSELRAFAEELQASVPEVDAAEDATDAKEAFFNLAVKQLFFDQGVPSIIDTDSLPGSANPTQLSSTTSLGSVSESLRPKRMNFTGSEYRHSVFTGQKDEGKVRFFAGLSEDDKTAILCRALPDEARARLGKKNCGKAKLFADLPDSQKKDLLNAHLCQLDAKLYIASLTDADTTISKDDVRLVPLPNSGKVMLFGRGLTDEEKFNVLKHVGINWTAKTGKTGKTGHFATLPEVDKYRGLKAWKNDFRLVDESFVEGGSVYSEYSYGGEGSTQYDDEV